MITHKAGDEENRAFWRTLVSSDPQCLISKETAMFAVRAILMQLQGLKAHRTQNNFGSDPVSVEEMFGELEKLCGGASGWQLAQKLGGF
jgi:hypothetical protein